MKTVFLFPGQGSQSVGMLKSFSVNDGIVKEIYLEAENYLGFPISELDTDKNLQSTVCVQLCLLISGVISAHQLIAAGIKPDYLAGHSVGAFGAAVISNVITFEEALNLVSLRSKLMENLYPSGFGMAAIVGLSETIITNCLKTHNKSNRTLYLANNNTKDQQVIARSLESINNFLPILQKTGARKAQLLNVSVPSHCKLLNDVSIALKEKIESITLREPNIPYVSNSNGRLLKTGAPIREDLFKSISQTVRWYEGTSLLYELGARIFVEMAPSGVLTKMANNSFAEINTLSYDSQNLTSIKWLYDSINLNNF